MKPVPIQSFYQQFCSEDAAAIADTALLESNFQEVSLSTRHNSEVNGFSSINKLKAPIQVVATRESDYQRMMLL